MEVSAREASHGITLTVPIGSARSGDNLHTEVRQ